MNTIVSHTVVVSSATPRLVSWVPESEAGAVALQCLKKCRPVPFLHKLSKSTGVVRPSSLIDLNN